MKFAATALAFALLTSPALADAVTYKGTLAKLPIVVELSTNAQDVAEDSYGRYFYVSKGVDIPLHVTTTDRAGTLALVEEVPCKEDGSNCPHAGDDTPSDPPLGATWKLTVARDGNTIEGTWRSGGRDQPVKLVRVGSRPFEPDPRNPVGITDFATTLFYSGAVLTAETSPYDYLKVTDIDLKHSDPTKWDGAAFDYVTDPRTLFQYPRVTELPDGGIAVPNAFLEQRDWAMRLDALNCMALAYQGLGWNDTVSFAAGTLGDYDSETMDVTALTPTIMSWTESGSLFCGGAHPYNHHSFFNLDVKTGKPLDLSLIFTDWVAKDGDEVVADQADARTHPDDFVWGPGKPLADLVKAHYKDADVDLSDGDCPYPELIDSNLSISFNQPDRVLFSLDGLPNVIQACGADLYEVPITELKELLAPTAKDYFPALAD